MRKLLLPALAACALLAAGAPVASAHKAHAAATTSLGTKLSRAAGAIKGLEKTAKALFNNDAGQKDAIHTVDGKVAALGATVQALVAGVPTIVNGLTALQTALQDPVTGLVGLNLARPQFGNYSSTGTFLGGTGTVASGPKANAIGASGGTFVIDFGNDVSKRVFSVNPFPGSAAAGVPQVTDCANAGSTCGALQGVSSDTNVNHVLVLFGTTGGTAPAAGFSVTAISG
jgi:hypothetical protein